MKKAPSKSNSLRQRSERRLGERAAQEREPNVMYDTQRLFHELQVHQIELELQNEELTHANAAASAALEKYTDLYDFAPVGYFTLDEKGLIAELNMAGAVLLGVERSRLTGRRFQLFVSQNDRPVFQQFIDRIFAGSGRHYCEVELLKETRGPFWAELAGISVPITVGAPRLSRIVVSDISARRLAEKEHKHIGVLAAANRELEKEITMRRESEAALRKSEERFRKLLQQSHLLQARLRLMTHEMLKAQEDQRKKISRELHDEVSQILLGINVQLAIFTKVAASRPDRIKRAIGPVRRMVEKAVRIVHRFARELRPAMLDDLGLIPTLRTYIKDIPKPKGLMIRMSADPGVEALDNDGRTVIYRIAQEALVNVIKHARASIVNVSVLKTPKSVSLEIADNGRSFNVARLATSEWRNRLGLTGMRERVEMIGGQFSVVSKPGIGTSVRAEIPFRPGPKGATGPADGMRANPPVREPTD
jgi:PAS domain S-box-containing protein